MWREPGRAGAGRRGRAGGESSDAVKRSGRRGARWCGLARNSRAAGTGRAASRTPRARRNPDFISLAVMRGTRENVFRSNGVGTEPGRQLFLAARVRSWLLGVGLGEVVVLGGRRARVRGAVLGPSSGLLPGSQIFFSTCLKISDFIELPPHGIRPFKVYSFYHFHGFLQPLSQSSGSLSITF